MTPDPTALAWFSLGALVMLTLTLCSLVALVYHTVGRHFLWALSVASRRAVDRKMGTEAIAIVEAAQGLPPAPGASDD